ncbi:MAG TPA: c-type cytochrome domain-containing protein, partial [Urbifossiella sp.]
MIRLFSSVLIFFSSLPCRAAEPAPVDFSRDVLPVLSDYCFQCHGPDANARKAKLRFDDKKSPFDRGVIVPGQPKESVLIDRITSADPDVVMPPPSLK